VICSECGAENRPGRKYCARCGARLRVACPRCGAANLAEEAFCGECGAPLGDAAPAAEEAPQGTARRFVTVLFADLVGFTPFSEGRDPEEVREFLMAYFATAREVIERFGGTVDKFIGDAVMAVWGAVAAREDDAERAVRAGLELADAVRRRGADTGIPDLAVRVGVLTGEAAVGPGGNDRGLVVGDLVNTASRLQSVAPPGSVLAGESTYRAARSAIAFEPLGEQALKGKNLPVPAWRAAAVAGLRRGRQRGEGLEPPFVDRAEELRVLKDALHATGRERRARLVSIMGVAGVGKTRLAWEFEKYVDGIAEPVYWHEGRSPAYGEVAFWALGEMVRGRAGIPEAAPAGSARARLGGMLDEYVADPRERRWLEPRLAGLLGLVEVPPGERGELFSAFRTLFERVAGRGTTVLVFEDLHLADAGLLDFIEEIPEWSRDHPILVITLARPEILERRPAWGAGRPSVMSMHLGPLPEADMSRLVEGLAPGIPARVAGLVLGAAAGVPLYAVELVRMLIDDGRLADDGDGRFRLEGDLEGLSVPESLHAVIGARLDRLDAQARGLVGDAAVLGQAFSVEALAALRGDDPAALRDRLAALARREILEAHADPGSPGRGHYRFVQALIREVSYGRLTRAERRERHLRAAAYFEGLGDDDHAGVVAGHYLGARAAAEGPEAGGLGRRAVAALRAAAERAAALHSHEQAVSYCRQALQAAPDEADAPALLELAAESAAALAHPADAEAFARRLVAWQVEHQARREELRAVRLLGRILVERRDPGSAVRLLEEALRFADEGENPIEVAELKAVLARAHMLVGNAAEALATADAGLVLAEGHGLIPVITQALITKGVVLGDLGRPREGVALLQGALELAVEHDLPTTELRARVNLSHLLWDDDPAGQLVNLRAGFDQARRLGNRSWAILFVGNLFDVLRAMGDFNGALSLLEGLDLEGLAPEQQLSLQLVRMSVLWYRQDPGAARREVDRLGDLAAASPDLQGRYYALNFRATAAILAGDPAAAFEIGRRARAENPMGLSDWLFPAGEAAIWLRDRDRLTEVIDGVAQVRPAGRSYSAWRIELEACRDALDGRADEAAAGFSAASRLWEGLGLKLLLAYNRIHTALLCPIEPDRSQAAEEARRLCEEMGAPALIALLDLAAAAAPA
jgi:class 3 adenylate cyclase/tetratricopeptide (TPR) repeat protein